MSLTARTLEENGIATVILGSARDIVEFCGVPRFQFTDFPLGNPCGVPYDRVMQREILSQTLDLFVSATKPDTTRETAFSWPGDNVWRENYSRVGPDNIDQLKALGQQRREKQKADRADGNVRTD